MKCNRCRIEIDHEGWCAECDLTVHPPQPRKPAPKPPKFIKVEDKFVPEVKVARAPRKIKKAAAKK